MKHVVSATFSTYAEASNAIAALESRGFLDSQISVLSTGTADGKPFEIHEGNKAAEGATFGGSMGAIAGALLAGLATVGAIVVPGGAIVAAGPMVAALAGAGAGGTAGGLIGALIGAGVPEHEAKVHEDAVLNRNEVLVAIQANDKTQEKLAKEIVNQFHAQNVAA